MIGDHDYVETTPGGIATILPSGQSSRSDLLPSVLETVRNVFDQYVVPLGTVAYR